MTHYLIFPGGVGLLKPFGAQLITLQALDAGHGVAGFCFPCLVLVLFSSFFAMPPLFSYGMEWFMLCCGMAEIRNVFSTL